MASMLQRDKVLQPADVVELLRHGGAQPVARHVPRDAEVLLQKGLACGRAGASHDVPAVVVE